MSEIYLVDCGTSDSVVNNFRDPGGYRAEPGKASILTSVA